MKQLFYIGFLSCMLYACVGQGKQKPLAHVDSITSFTKEPDLYDFSDGVSYELTDSIPVVSTTKINYLSKDKIIAEVLIINKNKEGIWLYKELLPSDSNKASLFFVSDQRRTAVNYIHRSNDTALSLSRLNLIPVLVPDMIAEKFVYLKAGDSIYKTTNLAFQYDINSRIRETDSCFYVEYYCRFPLIKNGKHVSVKARFDKQTKLPVYFVVSGGKDVDVAKVKVSLMR